MFKDRKIKKKIKEATKPQLPFDEFCSQNDIGKEKTKTPKRRRFGNLAKAITSASAAVVIFLSIFLPLYFQNGNVDLPRYQTDDVKINLISESEIKSIEGLHLFDFDSIELYSTMYFTTPLDESVDTILSYNVLGVVVGFYIDGELYAFEFDYIVHCYKNYEFVELPLFNNFENSITNSGIEYKFKVLQNTSTGDALIQFVVGGIDYYITVRNFGGITELNDDTIKLFIANVL